MKNLLIIIVLLFIPIKSYSCGGVTKIGTFEYKLKLKSKPESYQFYYRQNEYVVFIEPKWLVENSKKYDKGIIYPEFNKFLINSAPLKEHIDLYKFNLIESYYYDFILKLVYNAIASGEAAIMNNEGEWQNEIYNVVKEEKSISLSTYYIGANKSELISHITCITD